MFKVFNLFFNFISITFSTLKFLKPLFPLILMVGIGWLLFIQLEGIKTAYQNYEQQTDVIVELTKDSVLLAENKDLKIDSMVEKSKKVLDSTILKLNKSLQIAGLEVVGVEYDIERCIKQRAPKSYAQEFFGGIKESLTKKLPLNLYQDCNDKYRAAKTLATTKKRSLTNVLTSKKKAKELVSESSREQIELEIQEKAKKLTEIRATRSQIDSWIVKLYGKSRERFDKDWPWLLGIILGAILSPLFIHLINYFLFGFFLKSAKPYSIMSKHGDNDISFSCSKNQAIELNLSESLYLRSGYLKARPTDGVSITTVTSPGANNFILYNASKLLGSTKFINNSSEVKSIDIGANNYGEYLSVIKMSQHPGFAFNIQNLIGFTDGLTLKSKWQFHLKNFMTFDFRSIYLQGTGSILLSSFEEQKMISSPAVVESLNLSGYEVYLPIKVRKTETFWGYLTKRSSLLDLEFSETGSILVQSNQSKGLASNSADKHVSKFWSILGKLFGF